MEENEHLKQQTIDYENKIAELEMKFDSLVKEFVLKCEKEQSDKENNQKLLQENEVLKKQNSVFLQIHSDSVKKMHFNEQKYQTNIQSLSQENELLKQLVKQLRLDSENKNLELEEYKNRSEEAIKVYQNANDKWYFMAQQLEMENKNLKARLQTIDLTRNSSNQ
ncbi:MAG: hypothetical protein HWD61_12870 [Parachlamydiaceae bacterium]|nr:MAG: hypothetical protein HWD61_12870 [Parachlamydiaceae bacterium]